MTETRTGLNNWLGESGTRYYQELVRQASRVASEIVEQATNGTPRVVDVIRKQRPWTPTPHWESQLYGLPWMD